MDETDDVEEEILRADDLNLGHWNEHLRHPPWVTYSWPVNLAVRPA